MCACPGGACGCRGFLRLVEQREREFVAVVLVGGQPADVDAHVIVGARVLAFHDGEPAFARVVPDDVVALEVRRGAFGLRDFLLIRVEPGDADRDAIRDYLI